MQTRCHTAGSWWPLTGHSHRVIFVDLMTSLYEILEPAWCGINTSIWIILPDYTSWSCLWLQHQESGRHSAPSPCCCCPVSAPQTAPQCWTFVSCPARSLFSPPARDLGDCGRSKPSTFILCWLRERMYYYGKHITRWNNIPASHKSI